MLSPRRFPPPWIVEDHLAYFIIKDSNGQALAYVYYEEEPRRQAAAKQLSAKDRDELCQVAGAADYSENEPGRRFSSQAPHQG